MAEQQLDLDALLQADDSSDGDGEDELDPAALHRRLEDILNSADDSDPSQITRHHHHHQQNSLAPDLHPVNPPLDSSNSPANRPSSSSSSADLPPLPLNSDVPRSRFVEFGSKHSPSPSIAILGKTSSSRPGAALAAAAAASRQASTPHSTSTHTKYKREFVPSEITPKKLSFAQESSEMPGPFVGDIGISQTQNRTRLEGTISLPVLDTLEDDNTLTGLLHRQFHTTDDLQEHGNGQSLFAPQARREDATLAVQASMVYNGTNSTSSSKNDTLQSGKSELEDDPSLFEEETSHDEAVSDLWGKERGLDLEDEVQSRNDGDADSSDDDSNQEAIVSLLAEDAFEEEEQSTGQQQNPSMDKPTQASPPPNFSPQKSAKPRQSALAMAEEAEKKAAFSGLHMAEGAAAQPMHLEGMKIGPPAIGYLHIDSVGLISQALASPTTLRDHGTGQALAVHGNHIAVGLSKGNVLLAPLKSGAAKVGDSVDTRTLFLSNVDKSPTAVTSVSFNMQGDLLLVGHANGFLVLWDVLRAIIAKVMNVEHNAAIVHTAFLGQDLQAARSPKAVSADCKGLVLLHSFTVVPLLRRFSVATQCLLDGQRTGMVLCLSPLLFEDGSDNSGGFSMVTPSATTVTSMGLSSMMGGMVGGVVPGKSSDSGRKFMYEGGSAEEGGGVVVFVTHQTILVVRLTPSVEVYAKLARPDGIRDGGIPYIAWRRVQTQSGASARGSGNISINHGAKVMQNLTTEQMESGKNSDEGDENENHPLLALAWDKRVFILQLMKGELKTVGGWDLDSVACGVAWLEEQMVVVLTSKAQICLFTKEGLEVERGAIQSEELRRNSAISYHTHILNSFGNPEKTYHNSLAVRGATMYLLGPLQLWRACLLPWQERIKALQNAGDWMGAFHIGMEVYDGRALGVVGLPRGTDLLREAVTPTLLDLLFAYMDEAFTYLSLSFGNLSLADGDTKWVRGRLETEGVKVQAKEQYARVGGVSIEFCVHIGQIDVLFDRVFNKFCSVGQRGTFLELLEPYILKDTLTGLAPEVMQALVEYYSQRGWLQRVEQCVLHMDIASVDFNQVVRLCRENGLYNALIYLFNKGLDDFKSPLEELLVVAQDVSKPSAQAFGYKMLVYLKYCFTGTAFPPGHGQISSSRLPALRAELLQCLLDDKPLSTAGNVEGVPRFHSTIHPRLSYLLSFDLLATLDVLQCAFPEDGPLGIGKGSVEHEIPIGSLEDSDSAVAVKDGLQLVQAVVDALIDILERVHLSAVDENVPHVEVDARRLYMSKHDVGYVMEFIADYVALKRAKVSRVLLARIVDYLASVDRSNAELSKGNKDEDARRKEKLLVRVLNGVPESEWDSNHILGLALRAQFWQASACLLARKGDYVAALDSHLKDRDQPQSAFQFILDVLNPTSALSEHTLSEFRSSILAHLPELLQLSSEATLFIMLKHFSTEHKAILLDLAPYPTLLFQYLKQIMSARAGYKYSSMPPKDANILRPGEVDSHSVKEDSAADGIDQTCKFLDENESLSDLLQNAGLEFTNEMEELYVELLCQFEPKSVLSFLKRFEDYRLEHCLTLCQDYGITDAAAYLCERVGDIGSALTLVLADMNLHIHEMDISIARLFARRSNFATENMTDAEQFLKIPEVAATCSVMQIAIELCQRNTLRIRPDESESLWFRLLERFVDPLRKLHSARKGLRRRRLQVIDNGVKELEKKDTDELYKWKVVMISAKAVDLMRRVLVYQMGEIVTGMMGYIPLPAIMEKLLSDNGSHEFGDFKGSILGMLGSYGYEQSILFTAKHLVEDDTFHNIDIYRRRSSRAYAPHSSTCCVCNHKLEEGHNSTNANNNPGPKWRTAKAVSDGTNKNGKAPDKDVKAITAKSLTVATASVMVFFCGHAAHCSCICPDLGMTTSKRDIQIAGCPVCPRKTCLPNTSSVNRKNKHTQRTTDSK